MKYKSIIIILMIVVYSKPCLAENRFQILKTENIHNILRLDTRTGSVMQISLNPNLEIKIVSDIVDTSESKDGRFELYPTYNMWNFLLLDTFYGRVWQVQFSLNHSQGFWSINKSSLVSQKKLIKRFSLSATNNIWTFLLIDNITGNVWKCQFSVEADKYRYIEKIK